MGFQGDSADEGLTPNFLFLNRNTLGMMNIGNVLHTMKLCPSR